MTVRIASRIKRAFFVLFLTTAVALVALKLFSFITEIHRLIGGSPLKSGVFISLSIILLLVVIDLAIEKLSFDKPFVKLATSFVPALNLVVRIKAGGNAFPEVIFFLGGVPKKGVLVSHPEKEFETSKKIGEEICGVWEPRPFSLSGEVYYPTCKSIRFTGRSGADLIREVTFGYGIK